MKSLRKEPRTVPRFQGREAHMETEGVITDRGRNQKSTIS